MTARTPAFFAFSFELDPEEHGDSRPAKPALELDDQHTIILAFAGSVPTHMVGTIHTEIDTMEGWYGEAFGGFESWGVHNWSSAPDSRVLCLGSYYTYEVAPDRVRLLVEDWRTALIEGTGGQALLGPVVQIVDPDGTDFDTYTAAVNAGSTPPSA